MQYSVEFTAEREVDLGADIAMPFLNAWGNGRQRQCRHIRSQRVAMGVLDRFNRQTARDWRSALRAFVPVDDEAATLDLQRFAIPAILVLSVVAQAKLRSKLFLFMDCAWLAACLDGRSTSRSACMVDCAPKT